MNKGSRGKVGAVAGCKHGYTGYIDMLVNTKRYPAHRLVFLYMEGSLPAKHVDHINGIRDDNRWCNVRHATPIINHQNRRQQDNNVSGVTGLSWLKKEERWQVQITYNRKTIHLGIFACKLDAAATRFRANKKYGFHENHGRLV